MTLNSELEPDQSKSKNDKTGLIARVVENWLTSANERAFQIPFCQVLMLEGEELIYVASHGALEKGKDVITRLPNGTVRAYQMKGGNIRLAQWREIAGQMEDLVCLSVEHPSCERQAWHESYLVTNGEVDDVVIDRIASSNQSWKERRGLTEPLRLIHKHMLIERFIRAHGRFLPQEARDLQSFLALLLAEGREPLDKNAFAEFIERMINVDDPSLSDLNASRGLASMLLLTTYIVETRVKNGNHWAVFEAWIMVASYVLETAERKNLKKAFWSHSFELAIMNANEAINMLVEEVRHRETFGEGSILADGYFYRTRQLMLAGALAAWSLNGKREGRTDVEIQEKVHKLVLEGFIWGEGATPHLFLSALSMESCGLSDQAESFIAQCLLFICKAANEQRGLPDPFISVEDSVRFRHSIGQPVYGSFAGFTYSVPLMAEFLARRLRRRLLSKLWPRLTRISFHESLPQRKYEWFRWKAPSANLMSYFASEPQSWAKLLGSVSEMNIEDLPKELCRQSGFLPYFLLVFPHRLTTQTLKALELEAQASYRKAAN